MTFQEKLKATKKRIEGNMAPQFLKIMHNATDSLKKSGIQDKVLKIGDKIPDFELSNQNNEVINVKELYSKGPVVITFYRGFWCPYCNVDLANLKHYKDEIESYGATLFSISPELQEYSKKISLMQKLNFDILTDQSNKVADQFGLKFKMPDDLIELYRDKFQINLKQYHGDDEWELPMPARFLVDTEGIIRYVESEPDYRERPDPDELIAVLKTL